MTSCPVHWTWCERSPRMRSALVLTDSLLWTAETEYAMAVAKYMAVGRPVVAAAGVAV